MLFAAASEDVATAWRPGILGGEWQQPAGVRTSDDGLICLVSPSDHIGLLSVHPYIHRVSPVCTRFDENVETVYTDN